MKDIVRQILAGPIQSADRLAKAAEEAHSFKQECSELGIMAERLASLLRQMARASSDLYGRPTRRITGDTELALRRALVLVLKCQARNSLVRRVFTMMSPVASVAFRKASVQLEDSVGNVVWLLRVSALATDCDYSEHLGLPPIALNEPILCLVWEQIAILRSGRAENHPEAAAILVSLARDNDRYGTLIVEEGGVPPLLKLAREGRTVESRENAAKAIGLLGRAQKNFDWTLRAGVCPTFGKILREDGHMKVQAAVAWAISELATNHPKSRDHFLQSNVVQLLVSHLALETVQEHHRYAVANTKKAKVYSIHSEIIANGHDISGSSGNVANKDNFVRRCQSEMLSYNHQHTAIANGGSLDGSVSEDPTIEAEMKAMAALALWRLAKGNARICRIITESNALTCFAVLLEKGSGDVRSYSAGALMEIAAVAEQQSDLRRSAFKPTSPAAKAVVEQLVRVVEDAADMDVLVPCIRAIGSLARTFRATETRIIGPLVGLLDGQGQDARVMAEVAVALGKFACTANFLHVNHCQAIVASGGVRHLTRLIYSGERSVQIPALVLLCHIAIHNPNSESLAQEDALTMIEWSSKQLHLAEDPSVKALLPKALCQLELYQSRSS